MAGENTPTTLTGITKQVYGDKLEKVAFDMGIVGQMVPFDSAKKTGDFYNFPVLVAMEQGVTYNGVSGAATALNSPIAAVTKNAQVKGSEMIVRGWITYKAMSTAVAEGPAAFLNSTRLLLENLGDSGAKRRELSLLYGTGGLGKVTSNTSGALLITDPTWSAGTWADMEGTVLEAWTGVGATATQHNGDLTISAVDFDAKTITVTGTNSAVTVGDWLYFKGARTSTTYNEMSGIYSILTNTGTLFNIDAAANSRWRSNRSTLQSPNTTFNFAFLLQAMRKPANRGFKGKQTVLVPTQAFETMNTDLAAARRYDGSYSRTKGVQGVEALEFHAQTGVLAIEPHPLLRDGDVFHFPVEQAKRIGSQDLGFNVDGSGETSIWFSLPGYNVYEAQMYADQAIIFERPSHTGLIDGITYPAS